MSRLAMHRKKWHTRGLLVCLLTGCVQLGFVSFAQGTTWVCTQPDGTKLYSDSELSRSCQKVGELPPLNKAQPRTPDGPSHAGEENNPQGREQGTQNPQTACATDVKQFCPDVEQGGGRIKQCLLDHYKDVSDACYGVLEKSSQGK